MDVFDFTLEEEEILKICQLDTRRRVSPSPNKDPSTHYYQSDGSGRDGYVLMDNGGLRPEYEKYNKSAEKIFFGSLRTGVKSPLRYFKD